MSPPDPIVEARALTRSFGRQTAVRDLSFSLGRGESLALFGPNGAGKTTLLRLLAGLLRPTAGSAWIGGSDVRTDATRRGRVGLISHQTMLYPALTAVENVEFAARLHGVASARERSLAALDRIGIAARAGSMVRTLSRGMQQRVSIARAIVHDPAVLLCDEPYTGLDAAGAASLTELLQSLRGEGATMVVVTHNIEEGLAVASHAAILLGGQLAELVRADAVDGAEFSRRYRRLAVARDAEAVVAVA